MKIFTGVLFVALFVSQQPVSGQVLTDRTPGQMKRVVREALAAGKRIGTLTGRVTARDVVFDVTLVPNPGGVEWLTFLNLTPQQFSEAKTRYLNDGFTVEAQTSVNANGKSYYSAVWLKTRAPVSTLMLPANRPQNGEVVEKLRSIDTLLDGFLKEHNAAGATVAVAKDGDLVYQRSFGWANASERRDLDPDSRMRIGGLSKPLTAVAAMQLVGQQALSIDEPILSLLRKARVRGSSRVTDERWNEITLRYLLQHRGGWDAGVSADPMFLTSTVAQSLKLRKAPTPRDVVRYQLARPLNFSPGEKMVHSDFGYCLLGRVIEIASEKPYNVFVKRHILEPAGMEQTRRGRSRVEDRPSTETWYHMQREQTGAAFWSAAKATVARAEKTVRAPEVVRKPDGFFQIETLHAAGGWTSTAGDLVRFLVSLDADKDRLLDAETKKTMLASPADTPADARMWYACGWWVRQTESGLNIWHGGSLPGSSAIMARQENGIDWAVLFNTDVSKVNGRPLAAVLEPLMHKALSEVTW